jgi:hypothetical protein
MVTAAFQATSAIDVESTPVQWWIEIEGVRRRYGSHVPSWASAIADTGMLRPIRDYFEAMPKFRGQQASPLDGSTKPHEFTVKILDIDEELTELFSVHDASGGYTKLAAEVDSGDTFIDVDDASSFTAPCHLYVNRETMYCTAISTGGGIGGSDRMTVGANRGLYNSADADHPLEDSQGTELKVEVFNRPPFMSTREVTLYECRAGLVEADAILFRGYLEDSEEEDGVWILSCAGFLKMLNTQIGENLAVSTLVAPLWGGAMAYDKKDNIIPVLGAAANSKIDPRKDGSEEQPYITTWCFGLWNADKFEDSGHVIIEDEIIRYMGKSNGGFYEYYGYTFLKLGNVSTTNPFNRVPWLTGRGLFATHILGSKAMQPIYCGGSVTEQASIWMVEHLADAEVRQIIHSEDFTWTGPFQLGAADVILQLLTSTGTGGNGAYDTLPEGWGAGIPIAKVNTTEIEQICGLPPISSLDFNPFAITESTNLREWLEENILRPCHLFLVEDADGKITVRRLWSKNEAIIYTTPTTINHDVLLDIPKFRPGKAPMGEFWFNMNWHPGEDKFYGKVHIVLGTGSRKYKKVARNFELDIKTVYDDRVTIGGRSWHMTGSNDLPPLLGAYMGPIASNFAENPCPELDFEVPYNRYIDVVVGQVVQITSSVTPDIKGADRGITSEWFQVMEATPNPEDNCIECSGWMIGVHDNDTRLLAPSAKVKSYVDPSPLGAPAVRVNLEDSEFTDGMLDKDYDVDGFAVDDKIIIVTADYQPKAGAAPEVATINATGRGVGVCWVDLTAAPANPPGAGDYIDTAKYDDCQTTQKEDWAYLADTNAELGAGNADAHQRDR